MQGEQRRRDRAEGACIHTREGGEGEARCMRMEVRRRTEERGDLFIE